MNKILIFELSGHFAHFNDPLTNPKYMKRSFNIIPKTTLFGIIGALVGLKGYATLEEGLPEFYTKLMNKKVFIKPINFPFNKMIVRYNSLNSFANNDKKKTNVIMQEEILVNPKFIIGIEVDESNKEDNLLINSIKRNISFYHIYLGKNEFPATLRFIGLSKYKDLKEPKIITTSVFPVEYLQEKVSDIDNIVIDKTIVGMEYDEKGLIFRAISKKIGFILKNSESIEIKKEFINNFKVLESSETICLI